MDEPYIPYEDRIVSKPNREPDLELQPNGSKRGMKFFFEEKVIGLHDDYHHKWDYLSSIRNNGRNLSPQDYLEYILGDSKHDHYKAALEWSINSTLLSNE